MLVLSSLFISMIMYGIRIACVSSQHVARIGLVLSSYSIRIAVLLYPCCICIVFVLCPRCMDALFVLCAYCIRHVPVLVLFSCCIGVVSLLHRYGIAMFSLSVPVLYSYCSCIRTCRSVVFVLRSSCIRRVFRSVSALSQYLACIAIVLHS